MTKRGDSAIELLRIFLLLFLFVTHVDGVSSPSGFKTLSHDPFWSGLHAATYITTSAFAMITGLFSYRQKSFMFKNISRILFIILLS